MRRFRFRPERILRLRRQALEVEKVELARALRQLKAASQARDRSLDTIARLREALASDLAVCAERLPSGVGEQGLSAGAAPADSGSRMAAYLVLLADAHRRLSHWEDQRAAAEQRLAHQRSRVVEAHRAVRVLERLRERQWARYRRELEREEGRWMDEAGIQRFVRRQANGALPDSSNGG